MRKTEMADYFHKIANGKIPSSTVLEDEYMRCILDHDPINPGHTLIIPKAKKKEFFELDHNELNSLRSMIKTLSETFYRVYNPTGISMMQNGGENSDLNYFHFHVFPRFEDDQFEWQSRGISNYSIDDECKKIKASLCL